MEAIDVVSITSNFSRMVIGRMLNRALEKHLGYNPHIKLSKINMKSTDEIVSFDISFGLPKKEFEKIVEEVVK